MTDSGHGTNPHGDSPPDDRSQRDPRVAPIDSEIDVRRAIEVALWLGATMVGALVVGFFIYRGLAKWTAAQDPTVSPLAEATRVVAPPAPNLQIQPEKELAAMRAAELERLTTWGWTDKSLGLAHMPIEDAIDRLAVPEPAPLAAAAPAPAAPLSAAAPASAHEGPAH